MGQNCVACLKGVNFTAKNIQDIDLSKLQTAIGLQIIKEDSLENKADTPIRLDPQKSKIRIFKGNPNIKVSPKALTTEQSLPPFFSEPLPGIIYIFEDDSLFQGQVNFNIEKHGKGTEILNGTKFTGHFLNNKKQGKGRLLFSEGGYYEGDFKDNASEGSGYLKTSEGLEYIGEFKSNKQHGYGKENWLDGGRFEGTFHKGLKTGYGKFTWADRSVYEGFFLNGNFHGQGTYCWSNGKKYSGSWENNKMQGFGTFTWPSGRVYEGDYFEDLKHGQGKLTWPDGRVYIGGWREGFQHGKGSLTYLSKKSNRVVRKKGTWDKGVRIEWSKE